MDRERLKQVQQTDLNESKVNEVFLDWLKNKGPTWLLVFLLGIVGWVLWIRYQEMQASNINLAFFELETAVSPESLEAVAADNEGIESVAELARLRAADHHLLIMITGKDMLDPEQELTKEDLVSHRNQAKGLYNKVFEVTKGDPARKLLLVSSSFGLAAIAESESEFEAADQYYDQIIQIAESAFPPLAKQAKLRKESLDDLKTAKGLLKADEIPHPSPFNPLLRDVLESALEDDS